MHKGVVKWFNNSMKYGFIIMENGTEIFFHFSEIQMDGYKTLKRGDSVSFSAEHGEKGWKAVNVVMLIPGPNHKLVRA